MKKKEVIKILVKNHHDKKGDLVSRPLVRAFNKLNFSGVDNFLAEDKGGVYLYGYLEDGKFYEIFTNQAFDINDIMYETISSSNLLEIIRGLNKQEITQLYSLIGKLVFGNPVNIDFVEVSTMEENASDRALLFKEYNQGLSYINPYERYHENDYSKSLVERMKIDNEKESFSKKSGK